SVERNTKGTLLQLGAAAVLLLGLGAAVGCQVEEGSYAALTQALVGECTNTTQCQGLYAGATDCNNGEGGICYCGNSICAEPISSEGIAVPARIQAQDFVAAYDSSGGNNGGQCTSSVNGDVDMQATNDSQGGTCNIGWTVAGEWLEYEINAPQA